MTDFSRTRQLFDLPDGVIYLDGNSLGPLPKAAVAAVNRLMTEEWGKDLIRAWNTRGWIAKPRTVGDRIARLIGTPPNSVVVGDTLSIKVYQALASALALRPQRRVILSDSGNFPSDLYMAEGLIALLDRGYELRTPEPEDVEAAINEDVAVVMLTEVDYRTGRIHDMGGVTAKVHAAGAVTIWDLAHSAGAMPIDLVGARADFAVGCTYKYLNGGPGAPAFIYVAEQHIAGARPALSGWLGHGAPFDFDLHYRPAETVERLRIGTPPLLSFAALEAALEVWDEVDLHDLRARSIELSELFIAEVEARCPELALASPRDPNRRGSQVSFRFPDGYAAMQALIARGVIGDFRAPDIMRFGFTPLYIGREDILAAVDILEDVMTNRLWDNATYRRRAAVT
ncbi:kynureninase [Mesorhizobium sp. B1-1-8]|uniref:kynureninase n=1 Tax=Mesorhizobium sp. B1-1-8 TaxID=2589976 RepID=UPI0011268BF1|nr:kynureninase [Mesorhizobium sp. B1-1-8]UCI06211.1 kynureninase [Mesorhizobium sp. B1-1-8]